MLTFLRSFSVVEAGAEMMRLHQLCLQRAWQQNFNSEWALPWHTKSFQSQTQLVSGSGYIGSTVFSFAGRLSTRTYSLFSEGCWIFSVFEKSGFFSTVGCCFRTNCVFILTVCSMISVCAQVAAHHTERGRLVVAFDWLYSPLPPFRLPREPERQDRCWCILVFCIKGPPVIVSLQVLQPSCTLACAITVA